MAKRKHTAQRSHIYGSGERRPRPGFSRRDQMLPPSSRRSGPSTWVILAALAVVGVVAVGGAFAMGWIGGPGASPSPAPTAARPSFANLAPPSATPLASPPAEPAGDGTTVTIETDLGNIVIEVYNESAPVAASNFLNLAEVGYYDGVVFHRIVPGFVIQGGDPEGTGGGGPGYVILDEPVVGDYTRGIVAMARTTEPNSQGSQFFVVLDDTVKDRLPETGGYVIFGNVISGMEVVDQIAAGEASNQQALDPVVMRRVTVQRP